MESGKMLLVALISAVSTYAAVTAWPAIKELTAPEVSGSAVAAGSSLPLPLPGATASPAAAPAGLPRATAAGGYSAPVTQMPARKAAGGDSGIDVRMPAVSWDYTHTKYARVTVVLQAKPGGAGVRPVSLNKAPLTVLRGTRLKPIKDQGSWVMVQAPSAQAGWVMARDLTETRPVTVDHYKLR
jgi:hypothetical protein